MIVSVTYNVLFEVKLLHYYFLNKGDVVFDQMSEEERAEIMLKYDARDLFDIFPTEECSKLLRAYHSIFKATSQGLIVGLRAESDGNIPPRFKPFSSECDNLEFTFIVQLRDYEFMNYTALPLTGNAGIIYVFRNSTNGSAKQFPNLSTPAPIFKPGMNYFPGDMLSDSAGNPARLHIAKVKTTDNPGSMDDWITESADEGYPISYVNVNDRYPLVLGSFRYRMTAVGVNPVVTITDSQGKEVKPRIDLLPDDFPVLQVDMNGFPAGFYFMHVESDNPVYSDDISFFLSQQTTAPFGVIQLKVKSDDVHFDMIDPEGFMLSPSYELRFRNRATHWRYIGKDFNEDSVTDNPLPLTRFGFIENVKVKDKNGHESPEMPNPSVLTIKTEALTIPDEKRFFSEIHINN